MQCETRRRTWRFRECDCLGHCYRGATPKYSNVCCGLSYFDYPFSQWGEFRRPNSSQPPWPLYVASYYGQISKGNGNNFDAKVLLWKSESEKKLSTLRFLEEVKTRQLASEEDDMDVEDKEVSLDSDTVKEYGNVNETTLSYGIQLLDKSKQQLGIGSDDKSPSSPTYTEDVLQSAINSLRNDNIPHYK